MKARVALCVGVILILSLVLLWVMTLRHAQPATPSIKQGSRIPASHLEPPSPATAEELIIDQRGWIGSKAIRALLPGKTAIVRRDFPVVKSKEALSATPLGRGEFGPPVLIGKDQDGLYAICFDPKVVITEISPGVVRRHSPFGHTVRVEDRYLPLRFRDARPGEKPETAQW